MEFRTLLLTIIVVGASAGVGWECHGSATLCKF